jgi:hypothetical protein
VKEVQKEYQVKYKVEKKDLQEWDKIKYLNPKQRILSETEREEVEVGVHDDHALQMSAHAHWYLRKVLEWVESVDLPRPVDCSNSMEFALLK